MNDDKNPLTQEAANQKRERSMKILYIEDNQALAVVACTTLTSRGYTVEHFPMGKPGFERFYEDPQSWDAALIDLELPDIPGQDLIPKISALRPNLPIVVFPGMKGLQDSFELYSSGASILLSKLFWGAFCWTSQTDSSRCLLFR